MFSKKRVKLQGLSYLFDMQVSHCYAMGETETAYKTLTKLTPPAEQSDVAAGTSNSWAWQDLIMVPVAMPTGLSGCSVIDVEHHLVVSGSCIAFGHYHDKHILLL